MNKISDFRKFKKGWNGYDADPISKEVLDKAEHFSKYLIFPYEIFPTANNSVQFEFTVPNGEIEIEVKDAYDIFITDINQKEYEYRYSFEQLYEVLNLLKLSFRPKFEKAVMITGSFNPPTIAHYHMIETAVKDVNPDYIVFGIANQRFLNKKMKRMKSFAYTEQERLDMMVEMTYQLENVLIYGIEQGYTYDSLCDVKKKFQFNEVYFACGDDKLNEILRWGHSNQLLTEFCFYILMRQDNENQVKAQADTIFRNTKYILGKNDEKYKEISSTEVRKRIQKVKSFSNLVPESVQNYIKNLNKFILKNRLEMQ